MLNLFVSSYCRVYHVRLITNTNRIYDARYYNYLTFLFWTGKLIIFFTVLPVRKCYYYWIGVPPVLYFCMF